MRKLKTISSTWAH